MNPDCSSQADPEGQFLPPTMLDNINIQYNSSNNGGVSLLKWLEEKRRAPFSQKATAENFAPKECASQRKPPTAHQCRLTREELEERVRIAIAVVRALSNIHEGGMRVRGGTNEAPPLYHQLSLENILLDVSPDASYCNVTLTLSDGGEGSRDDDMKQLGCILNAIFEGHGDTFMGEQESQVEQTAGHDRPAKRRGENQQMAEHLPLYLACIVSTLVTHNKGANPSGTQYLNFMDILQDLQTFAEKPEIYLRGNGWSDVKNNQLQVPHDSFYGRKSELSMLLHSLDLVLRFGQPVLVAVSGYAGTGKTCLLKQVKEPLKSAGGFTFGGKFNAKTSSNLVIFSALNTFFGEINFRNAALQAELRLQISESVGCGLEVLLQVIPNLRTLMMKEEECNETDIEFDVLETANQRWKFLLCKLINAISDQSRPLAIYFDDLHWCDEATLDLIEALVIDQDIRHCLFLVSYRTNADANILDVTKVLGSIQTHGVRLVSLKLLATEKESVNSLISEMLCKPPNLCKPLSTLVHSKTGGLVFLYAIDFLKSLQEEGMIKFNLKNHEWEYNLNEIRQRKVPIDVVHHLSERMKKMPKNIQSLLKTAAMLGFEVDTNLLKMAMKGNIKLLPHAIESGFLQEILSPNNTHPMIVWSHDEIRTAAYELIPLTKRMASHLLIASRIFVSVSSQELLYEYIFDIVNNMNVGLGLITSQEQRNEVSQLNLTAGKKSMVSSSFSTASAYFKVGIRLLEKNCWECNYDQSIFLYQTASEALFAAGEFDSLKNLIDEQLSHATCLDDKLHAYYFHVCLLRSSGNLKEAALHTLKVLSKLGQTFSLSEVTPDLIYKDFASIKARLKGITKEDMLKAPRLTDEKIMWTMPFMDILLFILVSTQSNQLPLVACRMISLSLDHGYCAYSVEGFLHYSHACYTIMEDVDESYQFGKMAIMFLGEGFSGPSFLQRNMCIFHFLISFWKEPIQAACEDLYKNHLDLLMVGDIYNSMVALCLHIRQCFLGGKELAAVNKKCSVAMAEMTSHNQTHLLLNYSSFHLMVLKLTGGDRTTNPFDALSGSFNGVINDDETLLKHAISTGKMGIAQPILFNRLFVAYWFKRYEEAAEMSALYKTRTWAPPLVDAYHAFYSGLTSFYLARRDVNESKWMGIGERNLSTYKMWATHSVWNWENKYFLLQAEYHFCKGQLTNAEGKYKDAIESARKHRFVHEEGLANELLSALHISTGNSEKAERHMSEAKSCYERWGAFAVLALLDLTKDPS